MSPKTENKMHTSPTSSSSMMVDTSSRSNSLDELRTTHTPKVHYRTQSHDIHIPNIVVFYISLNECNKIQSRKKFSADIQLLSYPFLIRLVNRTFNLRSNFTLIAKEASSLQCNFPVTDDFDVDGCIMNPLDESDEENKQQPVLEFIAYVYPRTKTEIESDCDDWCIVDDNCTNVTEKDNFELIPIQQDSILVTVKPKDVRQETFIQKATGWLHGSVNSSLNHGITKKEFTQMLDPVTGRLLDEQAFRQKIFDQGCEESIRKTVWCYLLRVFNDSMTNEDKKEYIIKSKERYNEMKAAWQSAYKHEDAEITSLANLIQKDVRRTDRSVKFFDDKENASCEKLFQILMTYSVYHPEPGYVQGMNDMAAPILYVIRDESLAYACFCSLMRHMAAIFHPSGTAMNRRLDSLKKTVRAIDLELWYKIEQCDIGNFMFAYRWLLLDCKREFPFKDIFRVLETIWASLPGDRFESNNDNILPEGDHFSPSSSSNNHRSSMLSSMSNGMLSLDSCSHALEETQSQNSSFDGSDSGYRDDTVSGSPEFSLRAQRYASLPCLASRTNLSTATCIPLGKWLLNFSTVDDENHSSDMFTIFLCVALLEQNRTSLLHMCPTNTDNDDFIGSYFTRLVRQHDARHALQLARNYHRQYVLFQMRVKQLLLTEN